METSSKNVDTKINSFHSFFLVTALVFTSRGHAREEKGCLLVCMQYLYIHQFSGHIKRQIYGFLVENNYFFCWSLLCYLNFV